MAEGGEVEASVKFTCRTYADNVTFTQACHFLRYAPLLE